MIVVISCGRQGFVDRAIECARAQTVECRVVVVENGAGIGASHGADVVLWSAPDVSDARNAGLRYAGREPVALWDDDDWYGPRYVETALAAGDVTGGRPGFVHDGDLYALDIDSEPAGATFGLRIVLRDASLAVPFVSRKSEPGEDGEWYRAMADAGRPVKMIGPWHHVYIRHPGTLFREDALSLARHSCSRLTEPDYRFATGERPLDVAEVLPAGDEYWWSALRAMKEAS